MRFAIEVSFESEVAKESYVEKLTAIRDPCESRSHTLTLNRVWLHCEKLLRNCSHFKFTGEVKVCAPAMAYLHVHVYSIVAHALLSRIIRVHTYACAYKISLLVKQQLPWVPKQYYIHVHLI